MPANDPWGNAYGYRLPARCSWSFKTWCLVQRTGWQDGHRWRYLQGRHANQDLALSDCKCMIRSSECMISLLADSDEEVRALVARLLRDTPISTAAEPSGLRRKRREYVCSGRVALRRRERLPAPVFLKLVCSPWGPFSSSSVRIRLDWVREHKAEGTQRGVESVFQRKKSPSCLDELAGDPKVTGCKALADSTLNQAIAQIFKLFITQKTATPGMRFRQKRKSFERRFKVRSWWLNTRSFRGGLQRSEFVPQRRTIR